MIPPIGRLDRSGTYALRMRVDRPRETRIGSLGARAVAPGSYLYVGSALGPGGVRARVARHVRGDGPRHWHVDHLRAIARVVEVWFDRGGERLECAWAVALDDRADVRDPIPGFGASDCGCGTHLFRLLDDADPERLRRELGAQRTSADRFARRGSG